MTAPLPKNLAFGQPCEFRGLAIAPIFDLAEKPALSYLTLDEAFDLAGIEITETSDSGNVPELKLENKVETPVLLLDGEELVGAKQNRVVNLTLLVPAMTTTVIPVSCVESGRWSYRSSNFERTDRTHFASGRAKKMASVSRSLRQSGSRASDQSEVWSEIDRKFDAMESDSQTSAMADMYEDAAPKLEEYVTEFNPAAYQVGAFYFLHGKLVGMDLFDQAGTFSRLSGKLIKSYAIDALEVMPGNHPRACLSEALRFLEVIEAGQWERYESVGMGQDHRLLAGHLASAALAVEGQLIHLSGFITENSRTEYHPGSRRRRSL